jgi:hypothetical protein
MPTLSKTIQTTRSKFAIAEPRSCTRFNALPIVLGFRSRFSSFAAL